MSSMNLKVFQQQFSVHAVGQGLFYSGRISLGRQNFKFAFDCGSYSRDAALREISAFEADVLKGSEQLDMLVISHFDEDHVNHIADLLRNVKKVKRLVLPFLDLHERLVLLFRIFERRTGRGSRGPGGVSAELIELIIDPTRFLSPFLDGDSEVYLIRHEEGPVVPGGNSPVGTVRKQTLTDEFDTQTERSKSTGVSFGISPATLLDRAEFASMKLTIPPCTSYLAYDTSPGALVISDIKLMEFIFYRRPLDHSEEAFFDKVKELFKTEFKIGSLDVKTVLEKVKTIKSATKIKTIFAKAARKCGLTVSEMENMNTTALCMLHRNLPELVQQVFGKKTEAAIDSYFAYKRPEIEIRHHFSGHEQVYSRYYHAPSLFHRKYFLFPNTLLTSDSFIKKSAHKRKFREKFGPYLKELWLIQVPHHGSEKNIDRDFITDLSYHEWAHFFINYGTSNRSGHPDALVLRWLQDVESHRKMELVNEGIGLSFECRMES